MPPTYIVRHAGDNDVALLDADAERWKRADRISWGLAPYTTYFRALWSDAALAIRFDVADLEPWHTMTRRDDRLWEEEVVEIFLDPAGTGVDYAELEINPANVVCDLIVRRPWPKLDSDPAWHFEWLDSRVVRWKDAAAGPDGWTATARIPWAGFTLGQKPVRIPPRRGDSWRFNVYRIKRPGGPARRDEGVLLSAWSPTGGPSFHVPAAFGSMSFA